MITGGWVSQIVRTAAALSVAEHLEHDALTADELARRAGSDPEATFRLLRACASLGLVTYAVHDERFVGTPLLRILHPGSAGSLRDLALVQTAPGHWLSWGRFTDAVRTGASQAEQALGSEIFAYFAAHEDEARLFGAAMTDISSPVIDDVVPHLDTSRDAVIVDVGGADGAFLCALLEDDPTPDGIVFDLPHALPGARAHAERLGLADRVRTVGGDFFESVPPADLHLLKFILHDWDDEACVRILDNCRAALRPGGRIAVVEMVIGEVGDPGIAPLMDMNMLAMSSGGRERSLDEFAALLDSAGLRISATTRLQEPYHLIEAQVR